MTYPIQMGLGRYWGLIPDDDPRYTGGPDLVEWLEGLSEKDRQKLIDRLMREPSRIEARQISDAIPLSPTVPNS